MSPQSAILTVCEPADGPVNFARDDVLLDLARSSGREAIRIYSWSVPTISFGCNEAVRGRVSPAGLACAGLAATRRRTGGRALVHSREITYAIAGPAAPGDTLRATYGRIQGLLAEALRRLGVPVEAAPRPRAWPLPAGAPCFAAPAAGELTVAGRKLVASAQLRTDGAFLQHGSLLIDDDQHLLAAALSSGHHLPPIPAPATLRECLSRAPTPDEFATALAEALLDASGVLPARVAPGDIFLDADVERRAAHFRDPEWTWRR